MDTEVSTRSINEMRIDALSRIAEACMVYDLPAPRDVEITSTGMSMADLWMDDDHPDQVDAWAEFFRLTAKPDRAFVGPPPWVRRTADAIDHGGKLWLGFQWIRVTCAIKDPEAVKRVSALKLLGA